MPARLAALFLLILAFPAQPARADDPAIALGDAFQRSGAFAEAVTEYKRFLFFNPESARAGEAHSRIASCLLAEGRLGEAVGALRLAAAAAGQKTERVERQLELVGALLGAGKDAEAELELLRLQAFSGDQGRDLPLHLALLRIYQGRWEEAEGALRQAFPENAAQLQRLRELLADARKLKLKSPQTARLLSAVLPGAGQAYAGDAPDALNALAVNGGIATLVVASAVNGYYPEAVLLLFFPLKRFYTGNIGNAGRLAQRRNAAAQEQYRQRILDALLGLPAWPAAQFATSE